MKVEAVALQLAAEPGEAEANLERFAEVAGALEGEPDLVVAPELYNTGYDLEVLTARGKELAEPLDGPTVTVAGRVARDRGATVVIGMLEDGEDGALYDTAVVVDPTGEVVPYRKTHLYPAEVAHFAAGDELGVVPTPGARLGVMICFEHAFPEIATQLALRGASVLTIPSAVPIDYEYLLRLRSRARAQDNQVFVVACNLTGHEFCGGSLIADPRGQVLAEAGREEAVLRASLDLDLIDAERDREPALRVRRPDLYT